MNPESFLITVGISLAVGMLIGYFAREFFQTIYRVFHDLYASPKALKRYRPPSRQKDSSNE
jgi:hypothetical protein